MMNLEGYGRHQPGADLRLYTAFILTGLMQPR